MFAGTSINVTAVAADIEASLDDYGLLFMFGSANVGIVGFILVQGKVNTGVDVIADNSSVGSLKNKSSN